MWKKREREGGPGGNNDEIYPTDCRSHLLWSLSPRGGGWGYGIFLPLASAIAGNRVFNTTFPLASAIASCPINWVVCSSCRQSENSSFTSFLSSVDTYWAAKSRFKSRLAFKTLIEKRKRELIGRKSRTFPFLNLGISRLDPVFY